LAIIPIRTPLDIEEVLDLMLPYQQTFYRYLNLCMTYLE